jgi:hypothetical protein
MELVAFLVALGLLVVVAVAVLLYVAYPHRGRAPRHARWAASAVGRMADPVRVGDTAPPVALLADHDRDEAMRERMRRIERVATLGLAGSRDG